MKTDLRHRDLSRAASDVGSAAFLPTDDELATVVTVCSQRGSCYSLPTGNQWDMKTRCCMYR